ncbi:hypothetical protein [Amycolatopsis sp. MtRt-6]|uniref:hypothetical protein n=1 Tax=Amycolatopsis sp. MtRt-6 TaxID=2792782 RepID=UPI001F5DEFEC|nr:hypothetical protein [Amycolatopsis sp. MtRt-6]
MRARPLVIELITAVSGSSDAQQVSSAGTTRSTSSMAAACSSATPRPAVGSAATSRRTACARLLLAGIALGVSDVLALSRPRGAGRGGAFAQALPPLGALVAALF